MRGLLGAIAADRHAAPSSRPPSGMVGEQQRAGRSLARLHIGKIFLQRTAPALRRSAAAAIREIASAASAAVPDDRPSPCVPRYPAERLVAFQEAVQRLQFGERPRRQRPAHMLANEAPEPLAQARGPDPQPCPVHRASLAPSALENIRWNKPALSQPPQQPVAIRPASRQRVDRRRDRIQKIETGRIGNENCRRFVMHRPVPSRSRFQSHNPLSAVDKLCSFA